jgi:hypothetical protein
MSRASGGSSTHARVVRIVYTLSRDTTHCTRTAYYVAHGRPPQLYPLRSGHPFTTFEAACTQAQLLAQQGYAGWIMRVREMHQEDWPEEQ